jgi:hypothetical protein
MYNEIHIIILKKKKIKFKLYKTILHLIYIQLNLIFVLFTLKEI